MNHKKVLYLKIAVNELLNNGIQGVRIEKLAHTMHLDRKRMEECFSEGDKELLMDTVEYAGASWINVIKKEIEDTSDTKEKIRILVREYTLGTEKFPASLSVYIDLWKIIKDQKDEYIKTRLKLIYQMYINEFEQIINSIDEFKVEKKDITAFSMIMTILSDVLHIQSIILENEVDFGTINRLIEEWAEHFFMQE